MAQLSAAEKLFGTTTLTDYKSAMAKKTYALLGVSMLTAFLGGYLGMTSDSSIQFFSSYVGWIFALITINVLPRIALWASKKASKPLALVLLGVDGFLSGLVLGPLLYVAQLVALDQGMASGELIFAAIGVTTAVFAAVTGYIFLSKRRFSAPVGLCTGMFFVLLAAMVLNIVVFPGLGMMGLLISVGVGALGVIMMVYATSSVLNDPNFLNPFAGALMLFAALFNVFVSTLNIIIRLFYGGRD